MSARPAEAILGNSGDIFDGAIRIVEWTGSLVRPIIARIANPSGESSSPSQAFPCLSGESLPKMSGITMTARNQSADGILLLDGDRIIDRGRGPEIAGTRITIYDIMDFLNYDYEHHDIARELRLTDEQVRAAVDYIRSHQAESDREYNLIAERVNQPGPPEVERGRAKTREELQQRIMVRLERKGARDHTVGS